jgi:hypothetical protein
MLPHINQSGLRNSLKHELVNLSDDGILSMDKPKYLTGLILGTRSDGKILFVQQVSQVTQIEFLNNLSFSKEIFLRTSVVVTFLVRK